MINGETLKVKSQKDVWPLFGVAYAYMEEGRYSDGVKKFRETLDAANQVKNGYADETVRDVLKEAIIESSKVLYHKIKEEYHGERNFREEIINFSKHLTGSRSYLKDINVSEILKNRISEDFGDRKEVAEIYRELTGNK
ncbi:MAG: hypothetical protein GOU98_01695 [Candidatus Altiarchaeota archaeon]|nr:hypothetical protein [Candidatus Altiarchaeota archaeon]